MRRRLERAVGYGGLIAALLVFFFVMGEQLVVIYVRSTPAPKYQDRPEFDNTWNQRFGATIDARMRKRYCHMPRCNRF